MSAPMEIPLKLKYRTRKPSAKRGGRGNYNGNSGNSSNKGPHPDIHGYRRNGYRCEPKWNPKPADDV